MAQPRRGTFAFDLTRPLKRGVLLKQGAFHKAFKNREFILYPGFLVYYDSENSWRLDLTKGETLGGRLGAVKLKGSTVSIARNAPRACKYGLMLNAPDPANKRKLYLMNASSKEERDSWIEGIRKATPKSPRAARKDVKPRDSLPREEKRKSSEDKRKSSEQKAPCEDKLAPHPTSTARQDTACEAAVAVANSTDIEEEKKEIEEMISNVNSSLKEDDIEALRRLNTATLAAISLASDHTAQENGFTEEEAADAETSIDMILGERETEDDTSSSGFSGTPEAASPTSKSPEPRVDANPEEVPLSPEPEEEIVLKHVTQDTMTGGTTRANTADNLQTPEPVTPDMTPGPEDATEMEVEEAVNSSMNGDTGKTTVMTMVTVACSSHGGSPDEERRGEVEAVMVNGVHEKEGEEEEEEGEDEMSGEMRGRSSSSTQILVTDHENTTFSVNLSGYDSDNTLSGEESHDQLSELTENGVDNEISLSPKSSPKGSPKIVIKEDRTGSRSSRDSNASSNASSTGSDEAKRLAAPENQRRRSSTPFVEKKGYLYKMGGQRKTWKLRYFVLRPGVFQYFKDTRLTKAIGEVKLKKVSVFFPGIGERKQSFQFTVHTESSWNKRADWVFAGQSEREMKEWIAAFKLACGLKVNSDGEDIVDD